MKHQSHGSRRFARGLISLAAASLALVPLAQTASASGTPGVDPSLVTSTVNPGDTVTVTKTVHTPAIPPKPDLVFLADTTGSMGGAIANVKANATTIMNTVLAAQSDSQFAAASYKDFGCDPVPYALDQAITSSVAAVQGAINTWSAGGGCDMPEAQINALFQLATAPAVGFRPGSTRIIVWFGDASGHDPSNGHTLATAIAALVAANIRVIAVPVTGGDGLNSTGQATAVATATGGSVLPLASPGTVSAAILSGLANLPVTVTTNITCDTGLTLTLSPAGPQTVTSGTDVSYTETITVDPSHPGGTTLQCTVEFLLNGVLQNGFTETVDLTVNGADLAIVKTGPALVTEGQNYTYQLTVTNNGPATATGISISDTLPANTTFVSADAGCVEVASVVTCSVASLANGASATFNVTVTAGSAGSSIVNTATVTGDQSDPNPADNSSTVTTTLNHNPVCTSVTGGPLLWPPNHKMRTITLTGATDVDGNPLAWTVTGVTQDEPVNGLGDGDTGPDAKLLSGNMLELRAERSGTGDGRVYRISFTVADGLGGSCTGVAIVGVPHNQGPTGGPIDSGFVYNSL